MDEQNPNKISQQLNANHDSEGSNFAPPAQSKPRYKTAPSAQPPIDPPDDSDKKAAKMFGFDEKNPPVKMHGPAKMNESDGKFTSQPKEDKAIWLAPDEEITNFYEQNGLSKSDLGNDLSVLENAFEGKMSLEEAKAMLINNIKEYGDPLHGIEEYLPQSYFDPYGDWDGSVLKKYSPSYKR